MNFCDVNVFLEAFREDTAGHAKASRLLQRMIGGKDRFAWTSTVFSAVVRIASHPKVFPVPSSTTDTLAFCRTVISSANAIQIEPGAGFWDRFSSVVSASGSRGGEISDAYLAALAIEHDCTFVTSDRGFQKFEGIRLMTVDQALAETAA